MEANFLIAFQLISLIRGDNINEKKKEKRRIV